MTDPVALTRELVATPSTPAHDQRDVVVLLRDRLAEAGFDTSLHEYGEQTCNLVATYGDPDRSSLCMSGHLDTVPVVDEQWTHAPHGAEISDGRLWGRGATDMKSGVAAIVCAAESYARSYPADAAPISLVLTGGEELGCLGAAALCAEHGLLPKAHALLISEPTSNLPLVGHRGAVWVDLVASGRSCHGSTPELGVNAVHLLTDALVRVRRWHEENPSVHDVLGPRTLSTGTISGGVQRNVVPDHARAELDFRAGVPDDWRTLADNLAGVVGDDMQVAPNVSVGPVYTEPDEAFVRAATAIAASRDLEAPEPPVARFITDASVLTPALGDVPTLIWGPGSADLAHVVDEWCAVDEIVQAAEMFDALLDGYAEDS